MCCLLFLKSSWHRPRLFNKTDSFSISHTHTYTRAQDSSGIISSKQLRQLLRTLGHNPSDIELRELVNQVDIDENGKIDFNEFIIMIG